ncbi:MAG: hypothetical protein ACYTAF_14300 [Planctomycetota bacterium]|jgi:hypothetical protein
MLAILSVTAAVALWPCVAEAQSNEEKRDKKLAEGWLKKAAWITDYEKALEKSKETGKPIFAYFTRSYSY